MCNSQWLPREVKLGDALLGDHQQHRKHRPPQSETYISEREKCLFDEFHAQATMEEKKHQKLFSINHVPMRFHHIVTHSKEEVCLTTIKLINCCRAQKQNSGSTVAECRLTKLSTTSSGILWK